MHVVKSLSRYNIRGVRNIYFYGLPTYPSFYSDFLNMLDSKEEGTRPHFLSVSILFHILDSPTIIFFLLDLSLSFSPFHTQVLHVLFSILCWTVLHWRESLERNELTRSCSHSNQSSHFVNPSSNLYERERVITLEK